MNNLNKNIFSLTLVMRNTNNKTTESTTREMYVDAYKNLEWKMNQQLSFLSEPPLVAYTR